MVKKCDLVMLIKGIFVFFNTQPVRRDIKHGLAARPKLRKYKQSTSQHKCRRAGTRYATLISHQCSHRQAQTP